MITIKPTVLALLGFVLPVAAQGALLKEITLEGTSSVNASSWALTTNGTVYNEKNQNRLAVASPWIGTSNVAGNTTKILRFMHNQPSAEDMLDGSLDRARTEYYFAQDLTQNTDYYVGFRFMVGGAASDIKGWTIMSQWQQQGVYIEPFVNLNLQDVAGSLELHSHIRNDDYNQTGGGAMGNFISKKLSVISPWTWYHVVVRVKANSGNTSGVVQYWLNGAPLALSHYGKLGYSGTEVPGISQNFRQTFGIYREKQDSALRMYFDDYKLGTSYYDVD